MQLARRVWDHFNILAIRDDTQVVPYKFIGRRLNFEMHPSRVIHSRDLISASFLL